MQRKDITKLIKALEAQGATVTPTQKNHYKVVPPDPDAEIVIMPGTASDHRSWNNAKAALRRAGLEA